MQTFLKKYEGYGQALLSFKLKAKLKQDQTNPSLVFLVGYGWWMGCERCRI